MTVQVIHDAFERAKSDVRAAASELRTTRASIDERVNNFLGQGWTGIAAESFLPEWAEWLEGATDLEEGLVAMADLLHAAQADFIRQDDASQAALDGISARIIDRLG